MQVCNDVPYTSYNTQCNTVNTTKTTCNVIYNTQCKPVSGLCCSWAAYVPVHLF